MTTLTRAGWPRPRTFDGKLPVPWVSPVEDLGSKDSKRQRRVAGGTICQVCGLKLNDRAYCAVNIDPDQPRYPVGSRLPEDVGVHAMDHGLLHRRCLRLALAYCPELRRLEKVGELVLCEVPPGSVEAFGEDVLIVDRSSFR